MSAVVIGAGDLEATSPIGTLLVLLAAAATLGAAFPHHALLGAVILGLSIPVAHVLATMNAWPVAGERPGTAWTLLAFLPTLIGAFAARAVRRATVAWALGRAERP